MVLELLFGIAILAIVGFVIFRVMGSVAIGVLLVLAVFLASYLLVGSLPDLGKVPLIGKFIPETGNFIAVVHNVLYSADILGTATASNSNLLVTVANTGKSDISNFTAFVDGKRVDILNNKDSLKSGDVFTFELNWKDNFKFIEIRTSETNSTYIPGQMA